MRWLVVLGLVAVGCVKSGDVACGNDIVCPDEYTCSSVGCLSPGQVAACKGLADLDPCAIELGAGTCREGGCLLQACGNGIVEGNELCDDGNEVGGDTCNATCSTECGDGREDPGEVCDDGNNIAGDGCSGGCLSDETCGNGIGDFAADEQCDDGNTRNRDGCSVRCRVETQLWLPAALPASPLARTRAAIALDVGRGRAIMFGGRAGTDEFLDETWQFRGDSPGVRDWTLLSPPLSPPRRQSHAMAYDARRGRVVLFGGFNRDMHLDDTWEFDGVTWRQISLPSHPSARLAHSLVYDAARGVVVLFGGFSYGDGASRGDTWEYDGTAWIERSPANAPSARQGHAMAYDPKREVIVLFGGSTTAPYDPSVSPTTPNQQNDTWEYDGTNWIPRTPTTPPTAREGHSMVWTGTEMQIHGGYRGATNAPVNDTWRYTLTAWIEDTRGTKPPARYHHVSIFDPARGRMLIFGGTDAVRDPLGGTHELPLTGTWATWSPAPLPLARQNAASAFDNRRGRVVMYGGTTAGAVAQNDTWELVEGVWRQMIPNPNITTRTLASMAFDAARDRTVLFGGDNGDQTDETWLYDGASWQLQSPSTKPSVRIGALMAYDNARSRVVLFGGGSGSGFGVSGNADTWEWDGTDWTQIMTATIPPARMFGGMTYDAVRRRIVMFGGAPNILATLDDTWEYDGVDWTKIDTPIRPTARMQPGLTFDLGSARVVLFGGEAYGTTSDETWEYDGSTWTQHIPIAGSLAAPEARSSTVMHYDPARRRMVMFSGRAGAGGSDFNDMWTFGYAAQEASEACGSGIDVDGDGLVGCTDDDCWHVCSPLCPPFVDPTTCPASPRCGDGVCEGDPGDLSDSVESCRTCPADCTCP